MKDLLDDDYTIEKSNDVNTAFKIMTIALLMLMSLIFVHKECLVPEDEMSFLYRKA
jgi:hypothetical protein